MKKNSSFFDCFLSIFNQNQPNSTKTQKKNGIFYTKNTLPLFADTWQEYPVTFPLFIKYITTIHQNVLILPTNLVIT
jgi:hypothetical protein